MLTHVIIGGGAAGFFGAIHCAQTHPSHRVLLLEKTRQPLAKVRISGGGRCNVTHACFDPKLLTQNYPRGSKELLGPFTRFQPRDTMHWFESRGVPLKIEEDGRVFPISDQSESIIQCLLNEAKKSGVDVRLECGVQNITKSGSQFSLELVNGSHILCDRILMTTGSTPKMYPILEALGHQINPLVPSLFTFNVPDSQLLDLSGITIPDGHVALPQINLEQRGPILLTHWGFSGPAVLKLSAWGARELFALDYQTSLVINWAPDFPEEDLNQLCLNAKERQGARQISSEPLLGLPKQLWKRLVELSGIGLEQRWAMLSKSQLQSLIKHVCRQTFAIKGKTTFKQEFVTCGGIRLDQVNFKTMESRCCPGLFFAGEILDIDGITGGFNFQNAWTTGWIAGQSMGIIS